jgi:hypothetical protein
VNTRNRAESKPPVKTPAQVPDAPYYRFLHELRRETRRELCLVSGLDDDHRETLTPSHEFYSAFAYAWRWQDSWPRGQHGDFWEAWLPLWPRRRGNRPNVQTLARHVAGMRMLGHDTKAIADALSYPLDTLRRQGILAHAETLLDEITQPSGPPSPPLPRVWSLLEEDEPSPRGYVNVRSDLERWACHERGDVLAPSHALDAASDATHAADATADRALSELGAKP